MSKFSHITIGKCEHGWMLFERSEAGSRELHGITLEDLRANIENVIAGIEVAEAMEVRAEMFTCKGGTA